MFIKKLNLPLLFQAPTSSRCQFNPHLRLRRGMSPFRRLRPLRAAQPLGAGCALRRSPAGAVGEAGVVHGNAKLQEGAGDR